MDRINAVILFILSVHVDFFLRRSHALDIARGSVLAGMRKEGQTRARKFLLTAARVPL
jgi:hypothetical protein